MNIVDNTERNKRICELRSVMSASEIGRLVGCSRNAVIGVWNRAGLCNDAPLLKGRQTRQRESRGRHLKPYVLKTAQDLGYAKAAHQWGFHPTTVWRWMKEDA